MKWFSCLGNVVLSFQQTLLIILSLNISNSCKIWSVWYLLSTCMRWRCAHVFKSACHVRCLQSAVCSGQPAWHCRSQDCKLSPLSPNSVDNIYQSVILNCLFSGLRRAVSKLLTSSVKLVRYFLQDNER